MVTRISLKSPDRYGMLGAKTWRKIKGNASWTDHNTRLVGELGKQCLTSLLIISKHHVQNSTKDEVIQITDDFYRKY